MDCVLFPNPSTYEEESSDSRLLAREREDLIGISAMRWLGKQKNVFAIQENILPLGEWDEQCRCGGVRAHVYAE